MIAVHKSHLVLLFLVCFVFSRVNCGKPNIKIGILLDYNNEENKKMFDYAIETANNDILAEDDFKLKGLVKEVPFGNEFQVAQNACQLLKQGVAAVIGPESEYSASHVSNICDTKEIPYIDTRWDITTRMPIINLYPHPNTLTKMYVDVVLAWGWTSFTILYETASWLPRMTDVLKMYDPKLYTITVRRIDLNLAQNNYRPVLRRVKLSDDIHIVVDCSVERLPEVLKQAQQVGLMTDYHQFIIANLDAHTIDLEPFRYSGTNITMVRIVDTEGPVMQKYGEFLFPPEEEKKEEGEAQDGENKEDGAEGDAEEGGGEEEGSKEEAEGEEEEEGEKEDEAPDEANKEEPAEEGPAEGENPEESPGGPEGENGEEKPEETFSPDSVRTQTALIYDAVILLAETLKQLGAENIMTKKVNCKKDEMTWERGNSITNFMRNTVVEGLTGEVRFDTEGLRADFQLDIVELESHGMVKVGTWTPDGGVDIVRAKPPAVGVDEFSLKNKTFIVLTALSPPYGMLREQASQLTGNDRFEGFGIDIIQELSVMLGFNYIFKLQEDGAYGTYNNATGQWNGMIRELRDDRAHMAITDLTITAERETGCDFTMPFMNLGISILYRKPTKQPPSTFSFISPFSGDVWINLLGACFAVSLTLFFLGRICPAEWDNPYPCIEEPTELENQFSFQNSMWFAIGALLQQGSEIAPKGTSTRFVAAVWWFFTLIIVSSYTANLAAFLTIESLYEPLKSAEELKNCGLPGHQCPVTFGAKKDGSTYNFFKEAEQETYRNMYNYMSQHPELLTKDNAQGLDWAKTKNYAFLMESSSIEYIIERHCDVVQIGDLLDQKGYGIAMKKDAYFRNALSEGVLQLQEQGRLAVLKIRWWKEKKGGGACSDDGGDGGALALGMANVEGIFYTLVMGVTLALVIGLIGVLWESKKMSKENNVSFKEELMAEIKFLVKCEGDTKVVRRRKSSPTGSAHSTASFKSNKSIKRKKSKRSLNSHSSDDLEGDMNDVKTSKDSA